MKKIIFLLIIISTLLSCKKNQMSEKETPKFTESYRSQIHFTPPKMWMNDPNGMVFYEGEYHLYYQHHPFGMKWGPMHWGHAVSKDLLHWEHLPIAIYPDSLGTIFSGSAVVDKDNTSGFGKDGKPPIVAMFTQFVRNEDGSETQRQSIAYSNDKGRTFTLYKNNPVIPHPGPEVPDFRDPKVFWHTDTKKWIMSLAVGNVIEFYSSPNLKEWTKESEFGADYGWHAEKGDWECPDLFQLPVTNENNQKLWVLLVSINPGAPLGGSATQYFAGSFDGKTFTSLQNPETVKWVDYGADNYAGVTWSNIEKEEGEKIFLGWMSNWQYGQKIPTPTWRSAMTIPRILSLKKIKDNDYLLISSPIDLKPLYNKELVKLETKIINEKTVLVENDETGVYELSFEAKKTENFTVLLTNNTEKTTSVYFDFTKSLMFLDRTQSGETTFEEHFASKHKAPIPMESKTLIVKMVIDKSSVEIFLNDGEIVMTERIFPKDGIASIHLIPDKEIEIHKLQLWSLKSIWQ